MYRPPLFLVGLLALALAGCADQFATDAPSNLEGASLKGSGEIICNFSLTGPMSLAQGDSAQYAVLADVSNNIHCSPWEVTDWEVLSNAVVLSTSGNTAWIQAGDPAEHGSFVVTALLEYGPEGRPTTRHKTVTVTDFPVAVTIPVSLTDTGNGIIIDWSNWASCTTSGYTATVTRVPLDGQTYPGSYDSLIMSNCSATDPYFEFSTNYRKDKRVRYDVEVRNSVGQLVASGSSANQRVRELILP